MRFDKEPPVLESGQSPLQPINIHATVEQPSRLKRRAIIALGTAATVFVGANVVGGLIDGDWLCGAKAVYHKDVTEFIGCFTHDDPAVEGAADGIDLKSETIIDGSMNLTFGTISMQMSGWGEFKYEDWLDRKIPGDSPTLVTLHYNEGDTRTSEVQGMGCIRLAKDYKKGIEQDDSDENTVSYSVKWSNDGTSVTGVPINAGVLGYCGLHATTANEALWDEDAILEAMGNDQRNYLHKMMPDLIVAAAGYQGCPENLLDMDAVVAAIQKYVLGDISYKIMHNDDLSDVQKAAQTVAINKAFDTPGVVDVKIQPPKIRQNQYKQDYEDLRAYYENPDNGPDGISLTIGDITEHDCDVSGLIPQGAGN